MITKYLSKYYQAKYDKVLFLWLACFAFNIITLLFVHYKINSSGPTLALHYNVIFGVDWYGAGKNLYTIPLVGFIITIVNLFLYRTLKKQGMFLSFLCGLVSLFVQIILLVAVIFLARVN